MNGSLTGLDVKRAESDIASFESDYFDVEDSLRVAFQDLYVWLNDHWASENAVSYTTINARNINQTLSRFMTVGRHIINGADEAADNLARANGESYYRTPVASRLTPGTYIDYNWVHPCQKSINGVSGIDVEGAKIVLTTFELQMKKALSGLDAMPDGIAFYDPDGTMLAKYDRNIKDFKQTFEELLSSMKQDIKGYLDKEVDNLLLAKEKAVDSMTA